MNGAAYGLRLRSDCTGWWLLLRLGEELMGLYVVGRRLCDEYMLLFER